MTRELDLFEQIAEQMSFAANEGERKSGRGARRGFTCVSPALARAKVARPPKTNREPRQARPAASQLEHPPPVRAMQRIVCRKLELVAALRARKEALNLSHETIDGLIGWADRYSAKALAPVPRKGLSGETLQLLLDALGLGIAAVVLVEDPAQAILMKPRWTPRGPSGPRPTDGALFCDGVRETLRSTTEDPHVETAPELPPEA